MANPVEFEFQRSRGIVWVCDVAGSSSRLNSEDGVEDTEIFLPRLYWIAALAVESAGGKFIKWTGDGFLAWFETALHRDVHGTIRRCLDAVWHLTVLVNVTQLGLDPKRRFKIRHGIAYEQDALLTKIKHEGGFESLDLMGRAVVLAFRLSSIATDFPEITTHRDIVEAVGNDSAFAFRKWKPNSEERLKFFKDERWGTNALYVSGARKPRRRSKAAVLKLAKSAIEKAESNLPTVDPSVAFSNSLLEGMANGPEWSRAVVLEYIRFLREELLASLKTITDLVEKLPNAPKITVP
jgi:class 3 adenylate cyclase